MAPLYLCKRIKTHSDTHNYLTRNRLNIAPPHARSKIRSNSFFISVSKKFNELSRHIDVNNISLHTFKLKCKKHILNNQ